MKKLEWTNVGRRVAEVFTDDWQPIRDDDGACLILDSRYVDIDRAFACLSGGGAREKCLNS